MDQLAPLAADELVPADHPAAVSHPHFPSSSIVPLDHFRHMRRSKRGVVQAVVEIVPTPNAALVLILVVPPGSKTHRHFLATNSGLVLLPASASRSPNSAIASSFSKPSSTATAVMS